VGLGLHLGLGVGDGDGEPDPVHDHDVREVVAHVGDLLRGQPRLLEDLLEDRDLLEVALVDVGEAGRAGALPGGDRDPPADHPRLDAEAAQPLEGDAVLRVEGLDLGEASLRRRAPASRCRRS
jgi:hypothetical protein